MKKYLAIIILFCACQSESKEAQDNDVKEVIPPSEWIANATIYEVNLRQHTAEGNLEAFKKDLPRLKELGVDVLWFMPIQAIGEKNRKATGDTFVSDLPNPDYDRFWGSPYSIQDYTKVNPRYGSLDDFKAVVDEAHELGLKVILDWVANHTAWDHEWINNEGWHTTDSSGNIIDPSDENGVSFGWTDVADLNYDNADMRLAMISDMSFWVKECDIDGFRCDVAMEVPTDFWEQARDSLEQVKKLFMLAESEAHQPSQFDKAFDAYYGWEMHHVFNKLFKGEVNTTEISRVMKNKDSLNGDHVFAMNFITNHDENSWNGTINERLGESWKAMAVLSYALRGMPLIYSGQEAGLNHRLKFFEKDSINWNKEGADSYFAFYKRLNEIKEDSAFSVHSAIKIDEEYENKDLAIIDRGANSEYRIIVNCSAKNWVIEGHEIDLTTNYNVIESDNHFESDKEYAESELGPWGYVILKKSDQAGE